jgi:plasmid stabilization system protein ParE
MKIYALSEEAEFDYFEAFDFIANYSETAALKWERRMIEAFDLLAQFPLAGKVRPEYGSETLRFWIEGDYVVLYDPSSDPLRIIAILHGAQDFASLLSKRVQDYKLNQTDEN